jgi:hypothetical protein
VADGLEVGTVALKLIWADDLGMRAVGFEADKTCLGWMV